MRTSTVWRALLFSGVALSLAIGTQAGAASRPAVGRVGDGAPPPPALPTAPDGTILSPVQVSQLAPNPDQKVIIILRNQYRGLPARGATAATRASAIASDQGSIAAELAQVRAPGVRQFSLVNAIAATVSPAEEARLRANPRVQAVVPDLPIQAPQPVSVAPNATIGSVPCTTTTSLEPEALQLTNALQAQSVVSGTGVTVAFMAEGIDINNPDFRRGSTTGPSVFSDYEDFTADGPDAPTTGGEAFLDAGSIAAQGNVTYDVTPFVNPTARTGTCHIRILGIAPGVSLVGLKVFPQQHTQTTSAFVQAIQYAVNHGVNVLNESFGANPYPDNDNDPITLADDAAVAAGVTVVASSGDSGPTAGTMGRPASDPNVIAVGATTQFRQYQQTVANGFQFGSGDYVSNNISAISSAGTAQSGTRTIDVVAPGDLSYVPCTANTAIYSSCNSTGATVSGGTSESAPLVASEAALIIQAYRLAHGGATPSPALIKEIIMSTATDLGAPAYEQGAGLINVNKAVQAALSYNVAATAGNDALLVTPNALGLQGAPGATQAFQVQVTNTTAQRRFVTTALRQPGAPFYSASFTPALSSTGSPTFTDQGGTSRAYVEQDFTVPAGAQRLDAALGWNIASQPNTLVRIALIDPRGRYTAFSLPQGSGQGYAHVDVRNAPAGAWKAILFTIAGANGYSGTLHFDVAASNFAVSNPVAPTGFFLNPGQTGTFTVTLTTPTQPGDHTQAVLVRSVATASPSTPSTVSAIPVALRTLIPVDPTTGGTFSGVFTGGNGRASGTDIMTYPFTVTGTHHDLDVTLTVTDSHYDLEGVLVNPSGQPVDVESTLTAVQNRTTGVFTAANAMQFYRRDPEAGTWRFVVFVNYYASGQQTALPFNGTIAFDTLNNSVQASGVPNGGAIVAGSSTTATITITNTSPVTKSYFVDPRYTSGILTVNFNPVNVTVPLTTGSPGFFVPTESSLVNVSAESSGPTVPISMSVADSFGGFFPYGGALGPFVEAQSGHGTDGNFNAVAAIGAPGGPELAPGTYSATPSEVGPYSDAGGITTTVTITTNFQTQTFDSGAFGFTPSDATPSTGDFEFANLFGGSFTPLTLGPGQSGTITVRFTPKSGATGTMISGNLYLDTIGTANNVAEGLRIPYSYTVL